MTPVLLLLVLLTGVASPGWTNKTGNWAAGRTRAEEIQPEPDVLLHETFDENDGGWKEQRTTWIRSAVQDGAFRITTQVHLQQYVVRNVGVPATGDFDIQCMVETRRGNPEWPFGLVWGYRNPAQFLEYVIWMDGRFRISRNASLETESLVEARATPDLNTGFAMNELKLSRRGDRLLFYINGTQQGEVPFTAAIGPSVGFVIWNEIDVLFDDLVVTRY